ncbi:unnamed protein product [Cyclocybe aegerita]|uniref:Uncharacterized protein n=1 Tax=Cyclocybe aegerita TaxID=1973307 RepID=A0A8S0VQN9_CYCAE|nr:unnamed protein product [Cyclocybe aegerita]
MSDSAPTTTTAQTIRPALFLLVPLFTVALVVLALSNRPQAQGPRPYSEAKKQARIAYALIGALAALATLAGALPLSHAGNAQAEALTQTLLSLLLGLPVLHLPASYVRPRHPQLITRIVHTGLLVIFLSSATLLALLAPFLPPSDSAVPLYLPPALFLAYTLIAVPRVALALFSFSSPSSSSPTRPITIHVATHRTSIPLSLPSPASTASSFPFDHDDHDEDDIVHRPRRHRHEKIASVDSSTSTITAVDLPRRSLASPTPPLIVTHDPLPSSDIEHQHARLIPRDRDIDVNATYSYPGAAAHALNQHHSASAHLRAQLIYNRSRSLLVFLLAVQLTALAAYACALASHIPASSRAAAEALGIAHAACTVLAVTGTMSAYLSPAAGQRERKRADAARMTFPKLSPVRKEDFENVAQDDKRGFGFGYDLGGYEMEDACATPTSVPGLHRPPLSLAVPSPVSPLALAPNRYSEDAVVSPTTTHATTAHREPIILTYERPLGERSLLETTDTEGGTRSLFSSLSLSSMKSGSLRRAVSSAGAGSAIAGPSTSKKLFGWELAWDPLPLASSSNGKSGKSTQEQMESVDESFIDLDGTWGNGGGYGRKEREGGREKERESRKLKRNTTGDLAARMPPNVSTYPAPPMPTVSVLFLGR